MVKGVCSLDDVNELAVLPNSNRSAISYFVDGNGHENDAWFVFITNIERFGSFFNIRADDARVLAGCARHLPTGEGRYCDVGTMIRRSIRTAYPVFCYTTPGMDVEQALILPP